MDDSIIKDDEELETDAPVGLGDDSEDDDELNLADGDDTTDDEEAEGGDMA